MLLTFICEGFINLKNAFEKVIPYPALSAAVRIDTEQVRHCH